MKKNIAINIFGTLYNIDEDAYQLLDNYLQSIKRYFESRNDGNEIADDIEHRVAELLWEKKEQGLDVIDLSIIKEIIGKIGNAEEFAGEESNTAEDNSGSNNNTGRHDDKMRDYFNKRRLFRDPDNQAIAGVCSGLSHYLGLDDPVICRLALVLLFLFYGIGLFAYLILWLIVPMAVTAEDKLRMKGISVTPDNLNRQITMDHDVQNNQRTSGSSKGSGCLRFLFVVFVIFPLACTIILLIFPFIAMLGVIGEMNVTDIFTSHDLSLMHSLYETSSEIVHLLFFGVIIFLLSIFILLIRFVFNSDHRRSKWVTIALITTSFISLGIIFYTIPKLAIRSEGIEKRMQIKENIYDITTDPLLTDSLPCCERASATDFVLSRTDGEQ